MMQATMAQGLPQTTSHQNVRKSIGAPQVKSSKTCNLFNACVSGNCKIGKSVDPTCYDALVGSNQERMMSTMKALRNVWKKNVGDMVTFKTTGYEIADCRNPSPPTTAFGYINGKIDGGFIPVFCERENREATTILVAVENVIS